jgi:chromosomal replication initiation ATPase DnaA
MRILHAVARKHEIDADEILGRSRRRAVIDARFEVFYRLRVELAFSYLKIAHLMRKDHSTIMHGVNKLRKKLLDEKRGVADDESFLMDNRHQDGVGGELAVAG